MVIIAKKIRTAIRKRTWFVNWEYAHAKQTCFIAILNVVSSKFLWLFIKTCSPIYFLIDLLKYQKSLLVKVVQMPSVVRT
jgi:hypothetical protein